MGSAKPLVSDTLTSNPVNVMKTVRSLLTSIEQKHLIAEQYNTVVDCIIFHIAVCCS